MQDAKSDTISTDIITTTSSNLTALSNRIGPWAQETFGPTPLQIHAARMNVEMSDVINAAVIGDQARMGRALAGVIVVACAIAHSEGLDLNAAILAEQAENEAASWEQTAWGHWHRFTLPESTQCQLDEIEGAAI